MKDALRLVRRPRSTAELRERLLRKGHTRADADTVIALLTERGLIDDESYGRLVVQSELARKPAGARLLKQKLSLKRVPREVIDRVVGKALAGTDPVAEARAFAQRKLATAGFQRLDVPSRKRKLYGLLARRGFSHDTIEAALEGLTGDADADG